MQICEKSKREIKIHTLKEKYTPQTFEELCISNDILQDVKMHIGAKEPLRIIFHGNMDTGKSTLARVVLRYLYHSKEEREKYSLTISGLEQLYIRTDIQQKLNAFCRFQFNQTTYKKTLIIDDMDILSNHNQHIVKHLMENYTHIHCIFTCKNKHYVIPCIMKRMNCIQTNVYDIHKMYSLSERIISDLNLSILKEDIPQIVERCKSSLCLLFLYFEKMRYMKPESKIDCVISEKTLQRFTDYWKQDNLKECINILKEIEF